MSIFKVTLEVKMTRVRLLTCKLAFNALQLVVMLPDRHSYNQFHRAALKSIPQQTLGLQDKDCEIRTECALIHTIKYLFLQHKTIIH